MGCLKEFTALESGFDEQIKILKLNLGVRGQELCYLRKALNLAEPIPVLAHGCPINRAKVISRMWLFAIGIHDYHQAWWPQCLSV